MRTLVLAALVAVAALGWWARALPAANGEAPRTNGAQAEAARGAYPASAGVRSVDGTVVTLENSPVPEATVQVYVEAALPGALVCPVCGRELLVCDDQSTVKKVTQALREGSFFAKPIASTLTAADGTFHFEGLPAVALRIVARSKTQVGASHNERVVIEPRVERPLQLVDEQKDPVPGLRAWVVDATTLEAAQLTAGSDGVVHTHTAVDDPLVYVDEPPFLAAVGQPSTQPLELHPPRSLIVQTRVGGTPTEAMIQLVNHGPTTAHTQGGTLRLDQLRPGGVLLEASAGGFSATTEAMLDEALVTEIRLELRASTRLLLTVVDELGQPLAGVGARLDGQDARVVASAEKSGALMVLGPLPEGEYVLSVSAPGRAEVSELVDLGKGDHPKEVTLRAVPRLTGTITDSSGKPVAGAR